MAWLGLAKNQRIPKKHKTVRFYTFIKYDLITKNCSWGLEKPELIKSENEFPVGFDLNAALMELVESLTQCEKESAGKGKGPQLKLGNQPGKKIIQWGSVQGCKRDGILPDSMGQGQ